MILLRILALAALLSGSATAATLPEAVAAEDDSLVAALLDGGTDLEATLPDYYGATALMLAAERNDADLAERLIAAGADPNGRDKNGDTALNWAAYYGHFDTARVLLDAGADPSLSGHGNALEIAIRRGHEDLVQVLSAAMGLRTAPGRGDTMVMLAVLQDDPGAVRAAVDGGGDPDAGDGVGRPLLHLAARIGHVAALEALLADGAAVDAADRIGFTALMVAAREAQAGAVDALVTAGADVNHTAQARGNAVTPLHMAAVGGDADIVRRLAAAGASLDTRDADGLVPMFWALAEGKIVCVTALIELGADPTIANNDGDSVAALARRYEIQPVLEAMARHR